jgi:hypothetical protein
MPRQLGYKRRDTKKLEQRRFVAVARLRHGESAAAVARCFGVSLRIWFGGASASAIPAIT